MTRTVLLLRGVNVGGRNKLPMADLRRGLESAGCSDVVTYIQSGNVVLDPPDDQAHDVGTWLEAVVADVAGFAVPVVVRTGAELAATVQRCPYPEAGGTQLHVVFFSEPPGVELLDGVVDGEFAPETCTLVGADLYLHLPDGIGRAKLPVVLDRNARRADNQGTARNWNTVLKLVDLVGASGGT